MGLRTVRQRFRRCFTEWGRPERLRVDNGWPWGSAGDLPPDLALWLIGLGIDIMWNPPRSPQDNGVVERSQGVAKNWAEPDQCRTAAHLQRRLNREDHIQRAQYPSIQGIPRMTAFPELLHTGRPYSWSWESQHWDFARVCAELSGYAVGRRVDCCGKIGVYHHKLYVGVRHQGQAVYLQLDPDRREWIVTDRAGHQLHRTPAEIITPSRIRNLTVSRDH